jgi:hypothetical protein
MNNSTPSDIRRILRKMSRAILKKRRSEAPASFPILLTNTEMYFRNSLHPGVATVVYLGKRGQPHGETATADAAQDGIRGPAFAKTG